jgi:hypothetical protein
MVDTQKRVPRGTCSMRDSRKCATMSANSSAGPPGAFDEDQDMSVSAMSANSSARSAPAIDAMSHVGRDTSIDAKSHVGRDAAIDGSPTWDERRYSRSSQAPPLVRAPHVGRTSHLDTSPKPSGAHASRAQTLRMAFRSGQNFRNGSGQSFRNPHPLLQPPPKETNSKRSAAARARPVSGRRQRCEQAPLEER